MKKYLFYISAFFLLVFYNAFSQNIENVQFTQEGKKIIISYDLFGANSTQFEIQLEISDDGGKSFKATPKTLSGDIGKNIHQGKSKKISWDVLSDLSELKGSIFVFKVIAYGSEEPQVSSSGSGISPWIWIGGGALIVGGVTAAILLSKKTETADLPDNGAIPWPPNVK